MDEQGEMENGMMDEEEIEESGCWEPDTDPLGIIQRWHWTAFCRDGKQNKNITNPDELQVVKQNLSISALNFDSVPRAFFVCS